MKEPGMPNNASYGSENNFQSLFPHNPFSSLFFNQPFMFGSSNTITPSQMMFQNSFGTLPFPNILGGVNQMFAAHRSLFDHAPLAFGQPSELQHVQNHRSLGPVIEELNDDSDVENLGKSSDNMTRQQQLPIVEHPDDGNVNVHRSLERSQITGKNQKLRTNSSWNGIQMPFEPQSSSNGNNSWCSFQSSSVTCSGIGGARSYSSKATKRIGPNGVYEEQRTEEDSSGRKRMRIARALGKKGKVVERVRDVVGKDVTVETLHNLNPDEGPMFDQMWQENARQSALNRNTRRLPATERPTLLTNERPSPAVQESLRTMRRRVDEPTGREWYNHD